jgi:hypothetical protein
MPYIKPGKLLDSKLAVVNYLADEGTDFGALPEELREFLKTCSVCGSVDCGKTVVKVNGVYVHREDAMEADPEFYFDI